LIYLPGQHPRYLLSRNLLQTKCAKITQKINSMSEKGIYAQEANQREKEG